MERINESASSQRVHMGSRRIPIAPEDMAAVLASIDNHPASRREFARRTGLDYYLVCRCVRHLEEDGLIERYSSNGWIVAPPPSLPLSTPDPRFGKMKNLFDIAIFNQTDSPSSRTVVKEIEDGEIEVFVARFINGLIHQTHIQTGHDRPIGSTTANRIAGDLFSLVNTLTGEDRDYSIEKVRELVRLDEFARAAH